MFLVAGAVFVVPVFVDRGLASEYLDRLSIKEGLDGLDCLDGMVDMLVLPMSRKSASMSRRKRLMTHVLFVRCGIERWHR